MGRTSRRAVEVTNVLPDVLRAFNEIRPHADRLACWHGTILPEVYTTNNPSFHFQGIQRLRHGRYVAITGNSPTASHLVIMELASRLATRAFRSNCPHVAGPPDRDQVVAVETISTQLRHAGGFQVLGDYLAVGVEEGEVSEVVFYDLRDPSRPQRLHTLERTSAALHRDGDPPTAGAVALARIPNDGRYLLVGGRRNSNTLDFYRSSDTTMARGSFDYLSTWNEGALLSLIDGDDEFGNYQNLNLIPQRDGRLFLLGLHNNVLLHVGQDWADLFTVDLGADEEAVLTKVAKKHLFTTDQISMDAGAGSWFGHGDGLCLYAVRHWAGEGRIVFNEFRAMPAALERPITSPQQAWVAFYEDKGLGGTSTMFDYPDRNHPEYRRLDALDGLHARPSSVRWLVPEGWEVDLYDEQDFKGERLGLAGDGNINELGNLTAAGWSDRIKSCRYRPRNVPDLRNGWVELYDDRKFRDRRLTIRGRQASSKRDYSRVMAEGKPFQGKVSSVRWQIPDGHTYRLYARLDYEGAHFDLDGDGTLREVADLGSVGFDDKVRSSQYV